MMPPRSRSRICRTISLTASRLVLTIVSSSRPLRLLADVAAGVDVDRHQRLGLVDHQVAARLQPHLAAQRLVDLRLDAVLLEDRVVLGIELHPRDQVRHDPLDQRQHAAVLLLVVEADRAVIVGQQVAQQLGDEALLLEQHRRRTARLHPAADLGPDLVEVGEVADDVFLRSAGGGGADDDAAGEAVLLAELLDDAAQAGPLVARFDLARDADVIDRRHEDQEAPRHGDVRGEPGALGAERLLDDLDEDFLPFLEQVLDADFGAFLVVAASRASRAVPIGARGARSATRGGSRRRAADEVDRFGGMARERRRATGTAAGPSSSSAPSSCSNSAGVTTSET